MTGQSLKNMLCVCLLPLAFTTLLAAAADGLDSPAESTIQAQPNSKATAAIAPDITYKDGQLIIHARDLTLADVLAKVATLTGMQIDLPEDARPKVMPVVQLGPGPARQVLASLLNSADVDYMIQASDTDPDQLKSVLVISRNRKVSEQADAETRSPRSSPYVRGGMPPAEAEEPSAITASTPAETQNAASDSSASNSPVSSTQTDSSPESPSSQREPSTLNKPATLAPPEDLSKESINQQLQQMYQQRMQMIQQDRQTAPLGQH